MKERPHSAPRDLSRIAARIFNAPLALKADVAETIAAVLTARLAGDALAAGAERRGDQGAAYAIVDGVALIPILGELVNRGSWIDAASGLTSYDEIGATLRQAAADPLVNSVVLDIDSPGGEAAGMVETASLIRAVAAKKPVAAFVNGVGASAAYVLAAGASEIIVAPSATVGSIGVIALHMDRSAALADAGVKPTVIHAGAFKADGNALQPLGAGARARIQAMIDAVYDLMTASVGAHRPKLGEKGARATEAALYVGAQAVAAGLADRVGDIGDAMRAATRDRAPATSGAASHAAAALVSSPASAETAAAPLELAASHAAAALASSPASAETAAAPFELAAVDAEAARIRAILSCSAAEGMRELADHLAFKTKLAAEVAIKAMEVHAEALATAARKARIGSRMRAVPRPAVRPDFAQAAALDDGPEKQRQIDEGWSRISADLNAKAGVKRPT